MNAQAMAVIGAGYGDEGKGLVTDVLAARFPEGVVVRSNGGAQAGHTVTQPDGRRHVFHHVGSGALAGARTHLGRHFVAFPLLLGEEWERLRELGANLDISSDPRAAVATPFDAMINQALEASRGTSRHGSCGVGFGEAVERNLHPTFALRTQDLSRPDLRDRLERIRTEWVPARLKRLGIAELPERLGAAMGDAGIVAQFAEECRAYRDRVTLLPDQRIAERGPVIFEGAQGLALDQDFGTFPHVTRSSTGLRNMLSIAAEAGIGAIDVLYVTRCYATRHGAGPLEHEVERLDGIAVHDPTNAPNAWQGAIRIAPLDTAALRHAIARDLGLAVHTGIRVAAGLVVTCLDQVTGGVTIHTGTGTKTLPAADLAAVIADEVNLPLAGESWGPSREQFRSRPRQPDFDPRLGR